jgi:hypothetical protein
MTPPTEFQKGAVPELVRDVSVVMAPRTAWQVATFVVPIVALFGLLAVAVFEPLGSVREQWNELPATRP